MKFYIATGLDRAEEHRLVRLALEDQGFRITYDWTAHGSVQAEGPSRIREVALAEMDGVARADFVVVLLPGGRGTHAELGMALAWEKPVFVVADPACGFFAQDDRSCAFYHHPLATQIEGGVDELLARVVVDTSRCSCGSRINAESQALEGLCWACAL